MAGRLSSVKCKEDKLDVGKIKTTLSKLSDLVKEYVIKKTAYHELVKKVNTIKTTDTSDLV